MITVDLIKEIIQSKIYEIAGHKVMFDFDLSALYNVETRTLKQAVRRIFTVSLRIS